MVEGDTDPRLSHLAEEVKLKARCILGDSCEGNLRQHLELLKQLAPSAKIAAVDAALVQVTDFVDSITTYSKAKKAIRELTEQEKNIHIEIRRLLAAMYEIATGGSQIPRRQLPES